MKSKSKRLDKNATSDVKLSANHCDRKIFYNSIFADIAGSTTPASCIHKKSKGPDKNGCEKSRDKRISRIKCDSILKNNREDVREPIMNRDHQFVQEYNKVSSDGVDFNANVKRSAAFVASRESSNVVLKKSRVVASYLEEIPTGSRDPMVNMKIEEEKMSDRKNAAVSTDPECLGPCDPGSSVVLEGIVWNESRNGLLVVNVTWRGKTYVGTLMDSSNHHWGSPCFKDGSWGLEMKEEEDVEGRRLRRTRTHTSKIHKLSLSSSSSTSTAAIASASSATHNGSSCPDETSSIHQNLKEFACPIVNCSKRFKSLSGLKTHKCIASQKESCANLKPSDVLATGSTAFQSNPDKSLTATGHKVSKAGSGRCRQGALKRRNHFTDEHLNSKTKVESYTSDVSGRSDSPRCKIKFSEGFTALKTADPQPAKISNHRSTSSAASKTHNAGKSEKLRKNAKPMDSGSTNGKRKLKQSRISRASNNSSDAFNASANAFPYNSDSKISHKVIQGNGVIKNVLLKTSDSKGALPSSSITKDVTSLSCTIDTCRKPESNSLPVKCTTFCDKTHQSYAGVGSQKYGAKICSSPSHSGINCIKCSSPSAETQLLFKSSTEASKSLVSRPSLIALTTGCNKAHLGQSAVTTFPSSAPTVVSSSTKQEDMFCGEVPLEANTASEVFSHDTRHFKQAATSAAESSLCAKE